MARIECVYGMHFSETAQKLRENLEFEGKSLFDLITYLDSKYDGFRKELIDSTTGELMTCNQVLVEREDENTHPLSLDGEIREGDILTFF